MANFTNVNLTLNPTLKKNYSTNVSFFFQSPSMGNNVQYFRRPVYEFIYVLFYIYLYFTNIV